MTDSPDLTGEWDELQPMLGRSQEPPRELPARPCGVLEYRRAEVNGVLVTQHGRCYAPASWRGEYQFQRFGQLVSDSVEACDRHKDLAAAGIDDVVDEIVWTEIT